MEKLSFVFHVALRNHLLGPLKVVNDCFEFLLMFYTASQHFCKQGCRLEVPMSHYIFIYTQTSKLCSPTIQQLVDEHKVVLDILLADLAKISRHDVTHLVEELEHHGSIDILLGDCCQPDIGAFDMEEAGAGDVGHGRSNLLPGVNHVHAKRIHGIAPEMGGQAGKK